MPERELPRKPEPAILTKPFVEGIHPYTMMFLFLAYQEGAYLFLKDDLQRKLFDLYFTGNLTIEEQKNIKGRVNLENEIKQGFIILRNHVSTEIRNVFKESLLPYFKKSDISYIVDTESERKKYTTANKSILLKRAKSESQIKKMREATKKYWQNPENRRKITKALKQAANRPETVEKKRKIQKELWQDPKFREKVQKGLINSKKKEDTPEVKKMRSERAKRIWQNPDYRIKRGDSRRLALENPELIQKLREATINLWKDPEYRERVLESRRKTYEAQKKAKRQEQK